MGKVSLISVSLAEHWLFSTMDFLRNWLADFIKDNEGNR